MARAERPSSGGAPTIREERPGPTTGTDRTGREEMAKTKTCGSGKTAKAWIRTARVEMVKARIGGARKAREMMEKARIGGVRLAKVGTGGV